MYKRIRGIISSCFQRAVGLWRISYVPLDAKSVGRDNDWKSVGDFMRKAMIEYAIVSGYWPPQMSLIEEGGDLPPPEILKAFEDKFLAQGLKS